MLKIEKLSLQGFKSFCDSTEVIFDQEGITAVVGPNGCGKCVEGDTLVTLADGRDVAIRDLVEPALRDSAEVETWDDGWVARTNPHGIEILTLNPSTMRLEPRLVSAFVKRMTTPKLLRIVTHSGREVTATPYHPLFTLEHGRIRALRADELRPGVPVLVPSSKAPIFPADHVELVETASQMPRLEFAFQMPRPRAGEVHAGGYSKGTMLSGCPGLAPGRFTIFASPAASSTNRETPRGKRVASETPAAAVATNVRLHAASAWHPGCPGLAPGRFTIFAFPAASSTNRETPRGKRVASETPAAAVATNVRLHAASAWHPGISNPIAIGIDEIVRIEEVEPTDEWVYDLGIAETHNFVAGNIIVHNSNVADGINWVIGQQSAKALRGGKMEDVIFQGTRTRQASGMAEVVLTMVVTETFELRNQTQPEAEALKQAEESLNQAAAAVDAVAEAVAPPATETPQTVEGQEAAAGEHAAAEAAPDNKTFKKQRLFRKLPANSVQNVFEAGERITVGRRLFRTGESEYELNGRTCRLRDVQELFAGTGLGGAHYAIIEQGRIGQVLSAKPLDRRALIEDAAGISKFKMRQHSAELKLEASKTNLARVSDIIAEIERQQNSLKRQAQRARRYKRLRQEMRDLMRAVYVVDYRTSTRTLAELDAGLGEVSEREAFFSAAIAERESARSEAAQAALAAEELLNETRQLASACDLEAERARQQQSYLSEQIQTLGGRSQQFARDQATISERNRIISQEIARLSEELRRIENEINAESRTLSEEETSHRDQARSNAGVERRLEEARKKVVECVTHLERWRQLQRQFTDSVDRGANRLNGLKTERERALAQAEAAQEKFAELSEDLEAAASKQQRAADSLAETTEALTEARRLREERQSRLTALQRETTAAEQRLKSLTQIDERRTYFSEAVQSLMKHAHSGANGFKTLGTLADFVRVSPEHESMIEAALREELQYIVVPSFEDAIRAIDFLKSEGAGRATFLVLDEPPPIHEPNGNKQPMDHPSMADEQLGGHESIADEHPTTDEPIADEQSIAHEPAAGEQAEQSTVSFHELSAYSGVPALPDAITLLGEIGSSQVAPSSPTALAEDISKPTADKYSSAIPSPAVIAEDSRFRYQTQHPQSQPQYNPQLHAEDLPPNPRTRYQTLDSILGLEVAHSAAFRLALPALAQARVVPILKDALQAKQSSISSNGSGPHVSLTRSGERVIAGRLVTGGSATEKGIGVLALKREIGELGAKLDILYVELRAIESELSQIKSRIAQLDETRARLDGELRQIEKQLAVGREQLQQSTRERERAATHIRVVEQEMEQAEAERQEFESKLRHAASQTAEADEARVEAEAVVTTIQEEIAELRRLADQRAQELSRRRADFAARTERRRGLQNDIRRLENEAGDLESRLTRNQMESLETGEQVSTMQSTLGATTEQLQQTAVQQRRFAFELEQRAAALNAARQSLETLDQQLRAAREAANLAREQRAQREIEKARLTSDLEHSIRSCHAELGENIAEVCQRLEAGQQESEQAPITDFPAPLAEMEESEESDDAMDAEPSPSFWRVPEDFDLASAKVRLEALRAKIDAIGPVNMMALEELMEVEERFAFLSAQRADIEKAILDTQSAIAEIKKRSRERFVEAFHAINENFKQMFVELFGGGQGEMRLIDETDVLESGIEIIAQPPGKRLQNVLLLSGGEKAMSAMALVLAIFKYRPSPFCLLDEVDAPLDDVNIGRFADKVVEMSVGTQFMIITHSKRTMEIARTLYGVTMEDPGVSKLISVKLT